jgi:hypothetical protein
VAERFAEAAIRTRALITFGAILAGILLTILCPLIAAIITN